MDDSSYNLFLMRELLANIDTLKIDFDSAMHGLEAVQKVSKQHYDIIFLDLHMPVMDGY